MKFLPKALVFKGPKFEKEVDSEILAEVIEYRKYFGVNSRPRLQ